MISLKCHLIFPVFFLSLCLYYVCVAKELYSFTVSRLICEDSDPRIVRNVSCSYRYINRTTKAYTLTGFTLSNVSLNAIYVRLEYYQRIGASYGRRIISVEEDFCGYLAGTANSLLIRIVWPYVKQVSNFNDRCPFSGAYNVSDLVVGDKYLPPALPEGEARVDIHIRNGPQRLSIIKIRAYVVVKPKGAAKLIF